MLQNTKKSMGSKLFPKFRKKNEVLFQLVLVINVNPVYPSHSGDVKRPKNIEPDKLFVNFQKNKQLIWFLDHPGPWEPYGAAPVKT